MRPRASFIPKGEDGGQVPRLVLRQLRPAAPYSEPRENCGVRSMNAMRSEMMYAEYATHIKEGAFYGWPWFYIAGNEDPHHKGEAAHLEDKVNIPYASHEAHSAPLQIAFYDGDGFPTLNIRVMRFVTLHGYHWNWQRSGNKVVRLRFKDEEAHRRDTRICNGSHYLERKSMGRPVGIAVGQDGALLSNEDGSGSIWRVSYRKAGTTAETVPSKD